jgi:hypothetical protein
VKLFIFEQRRRSLDHGNVVDRDQDKGTIDERVRATVTWMTR